jgi:hypothetical protein
MTVEAVAAAAAAPPPKMVELGPVQPQTPDPTSAAGFQAALEKMSGPGAGNDVPPALRGLLDTLDKVNLEAKGVSDYARSSEASGTQLTPGEIVNLTMRCQEFMFHCQLTSNIANRSSDGIQQLFRQQS